MFKKVQDSKITGMPLMISPAPVRVAPGSQIKTTKGD